jgi:hypothetical protein
MNPLSRFLMIWLAGLLLLLGAGCHYVGPDMYIELANRSGQTMHNVTVQCPVGTFGLPELRDGQTHRHLMPQGSPCKFTIAFQDASDKAQSLDFDLGPKCPTEELFEVGQGLKISSRQGRS